MDVQGASSKMNIVFRTDASLEIGTGHVMRCLTLADALKEQGVRCRFVCREHPGNLLELIRERGYEADGLPLESGTVSEGNESHHLAHEHWLGASWLTDAKQTLEVIKGQKVDWVIVDHYALDARWETTLKASCNKLMVIDDLTDRDHACDMLLDQNFGRSNADYSALVPAGCTLLTGPKYTLLRPEFAALQEYSFGRRVTPQLHHLLITMGSVDKDNMTGMVLEVLKESYLPKGCLITVVMGANAPWLEMVHDQASRMPWKTEVCVNVKNMARLMAQSDLAIGQGGGITYERIFMGLPSLLKPMADNQRDHLQNMADAGLLELFDDTKDLSHMVTDFSSSGGVVAPDVVAYGVPKVCDEILDGWITLSRPQPLDVRRTFRWLQDDELRQFFLMRQKPNRKTHFIYWRSLLASSDQYVFSIILSGAHIGNAGIKNINKDEDEAELWVYLGESFERGKGIGRLVLHKLEWFIRTELELSMAFLHVSTKNIPAYRLYQGAGYVTVRDSRVSAEFENEFVVRMVKRL